MFDSTGWVYQAFAIASLVILAYLVRVNWQLSGTPDEVTRLVGPRWTPELLKKTYEKLEQHPIDYTHQLRPSWIAGTLSLEALVSYVPTALSGFTSGSSGASRSCWRLHRATTAGARYATDAYPYPGYPENGA
ncbi:hypothetical protein NUW58_g10418 [Xylaria curta]|uniref:Uncharacterized protein n=1 Tax=Xylaria curta TaxID=42375 RepID=A0ACC1ML51_9PEZI|nr:hypothetical protein NUW58_g10418 [Xylaria curta]